MPMADGISKGLWGWDWEQVFSKCLQVSPMESGLETTHLRHEGLSSEAVGWKVSLPQGAPLSLLLRVPGPGCILEC